MIAQDQTVSRHTYSDEDHTTWTKLYERQSTLVMDRASQLFLAGLPRLRLDPKRLPDAPTVSDHLFELTRWTLGNAEDEYLSATGWFDHIAARRFPVTNYIRRPHELDFTPLPDLFHEYFGHLAFFTDPEFADIAQKFGPLYQVADARQQVEIAHLWWFTTEFGLVRENGEVRIFGAGLLSSPGELLHALAPETPHKEFDVREVADTPSVGNGYHPAYFIFNGLDHLYQIIRDYARMENLPLP